MKKILALLFITIALIATFAVAHPAPVPDEYSPKPKEDKYKPKKEEYDSYGGKKEIHVTSPGEGPWAIGSQQAVTWWSLSIKSECNIFMLFIKSLNCLIVYF